MRAAAQSRIARLVACALAALLGGRQTAAGESGASLRRLPPVAPAVATVDAHASFDPAVTPAAFQARGTPLVRVSTTGGPDRYHQPGRDSVSELANSFTAVPSFSEGIVIIGPEAAMKIGGYVKADLIKDFSAIDSTDTFNTTTIPTDAAPRENTRFHSRQTRLSFDTRWDVQGDVLKTFVEVDFFGSGVGGSDSLRLRQAYGTIGAFTAGQTWTTFTDPSAVPQTLDFEGAVSAVNRRQGLVRWTWPIFTEGLTLACSLEDPSTLIEASGAAGVEARTESPDFLSRVRYERDWGEFQIAGVLRKLGLQEPGEPVMSTTAWGFNFAGSFLVTPRTKTYYQITFGEGIGSYRGSPDLVQVGPDTAEVLPVFGWMIGVKREITSRLTSNFTFSKLSLEDLPGQDPDNLLRTTYLAINLIHNPYDRVFAGIEYLHGVRDDVSRARGTADRLQISFGFYLP
ncbi:MAG: DcaP family trimeric outer membrane transporter [Planctomycetota bacterium]